MHHTIFYSSNLRKIRKTNQIDAILIPRFLFLFAMPLHLLQPLVAADPTKYRTLSRKQILYAGDSCSLDLVRGVSSATSTSISTTIAASRWKTTTSTKASSTSWSTSTTTTCHARDIGALGINLQNVSECC